MLCFSEIKRGNFFSKKIQIVIRGFKKKGQINIIEKIRTVARLFDSRLAVRTSLGVLPQ